MKNILISTGGSGGHVVPAKILREHLQSNFNIFISTDLRGLKYLDDKKNDIVLLVLLESVQILLFNFTTFTFKAYSFHSFWAF